MAYVYCHFKKDNDDPFYVGMGKTDNRPWDMVNRSAGHNNVVKKHGAKVLILIDDLDWATAGWWEVRWIKALKNSGFEIENIHPGGGINPMLVSEIREKQIANVPRGELHYAKTLEAKENLRFKNLGKTYSDEINKKKGRYGPKVFSEEAMKNLRAPKTKETRLKMSMSAKIVNSNPEAREKNSAGVKESWELRSKETRSASASKGWETRRKKQQEA